MELKRVVVTGLGALTPIGNNVTEYWDALITGKSGCANITYFDTEKFKTKFACELKTLMSLELLIEKKLENWIGFAQYALVASEEAIEDSKLNLDEIDNLELV